jgi:hypothetical protein
MGCEISIHVFSTETEASHVHPLITRSTISTAQSSLFGTIKRICASIWHVQALLLLKYVYVHGSISGMETHTCGSIFVLDGNYACNRS